MVDLHTKYTCVKYRHAIHHVSLKTFENIKNCESFTSWFQSCNKENRKILKEAQMTELNKYLSTKWNWIDTNFCSWLSERNSHSTFPQNRPTFKLQLDSERSSFIVSQISARFHRFQISQIFQISGRFQFPKICEYFLTYFAWLYFLCNLLAIWEIYMQEMCDTHVMLQFLWPVLSEPIDSKYINQSESRIAEKYKKCLTISLLHEHTRYELSNGGNQSNRNLSGMLLCCKKKANQAWEIKLQARMSISL